MLQAKLDTLPDKPGVYLFKDPSRKVIYIGKAKSLKHRVRSYFQVSRHLDEKTEVLRDHIQDLDYIITDNELEALFLERNLVKKQQPKFNIKLNVNEPYP